MLNFFEKLLPNFEKRRLITQVEHSHQTVYDLVIPASEACVIARNELGIKTSNATSKRFEKDASRQLLKYIKPANLTNYASIINTVAQGLGGKLNILRKLVNEDFGNQTSTKGLTFKQLEVMRLLDLSTFFSDYSMKLLTISMWEETIDKGVEADKPLLPGELKWLDANYFSFLNICTIFATPDKEFEKIIDGTSELVVAEVSQDVANLGINSDPFKLGFMPVIGDIIFSIREHFLEVQNRKYEGNKLRLVSVQIQIQLIKEKLANNQDDPVLLKQLEYHTDRVKKLEADIRKYEEKAGV